MIKSGLPRYLEIIMSILLLMLLSPLLVLCAILVALSSPGPVIFVQQRLGRHGAPFALLKFRTMTHRAAGAGITAADDHRITTAGRILRRMKLDEMPELINILKGEMSFVGPRPESPEYVNMSDIRWQIVLGARPGLTDPVTIRLRNEEDLMAAVADDRDQFYRKVLQPYKLKGYIDYLQHRNPWMDLLILLRTFACVLIPGLSKPPSLKELSVDGDEDIGGGKQ